MSQTKFSTNPPEEFMEYFRTNYPGPNTIISAPDWHARKIYRAAIHVSGLPELHDALESSDALIVKAQSILAEYIVPDSGISDHECINRLLGLLDGPEQRIVQGFTKAALAKARGDQ